MTTTLHGTTTSAPDPDDPAKRTLRLEDLGALFGRRPFAMNRVTQPGVALFDVPTIHGAEFESLKQAARESLADGSGVGVVVWGSAGVGKSHLLARLDDWAKQEQVMCIFLQNIHACPQLLPGYVLKCVISQLTQGRQEGFRSTRLYALLCTAIKKRLLQGEQQADRGFWRIVDDAVAAQPEHAVADREIYNVLWQFFVSTFKKPADDETGRLALRWSTGDRLDAEDARKLQIPLADDEKAGLVDEQSVLRVLVALTELARASGKPFILCFDQVDVLEEEQIAKLAKFLHVLIDATRNLLVITCGVQQSLFELLQKNVIAEADWARICQRTEIRLAAINKDDARQLLQRRLESFLEPIREQLPEVWKQNFEDGLFPLGIAWLENRLHGLQDIRPRQVITWAHERWQEQTRRVEELGPRKWLETWRDFGDVIIELMTTEKLLALIDKKVAGRFSERCTECEADPALIPPHHGNLMGLADAMLDQCAALNTHGVEGLDRFAAKKTGPLPTYDGVVHLRNVSGATTTVGMLFLQSENSTSTAHSLRKLVEDSSPPHRVLLVRDSRVKMELGPKGKEYLGKLRSRNGMGKFDDIVFDVPCVARLNALQAVIRDAVGGDLEVDLPGNKVHHVEKGEVLESFGRGDYYGKQVLLKKLLEVNGGSEEIEFDEEDIAGFIRSNLAFALGMTTCELAHDYPKGKGLATDNPETNSLGPMGLHEAFVRVAKQLAEKGLISAKEHHPIGLYLLKK